MFDAEDEKRAVETAQRRAAIEPNAPPRTDVAQLHLGWMGEVNMALRHMVETVPALAGIRAVVARMEGHHAALSAALTPPAPPPETAAEAAPAGTVYVRDAAPGQVNAALAPQPDHSGDAPAPADPVIHDPPESPDPQPVSG